MTSTLVSKEFREAIGRKMSGISNVWVETAKKGGKGLEVLGTGSKLANSSSF